MIVSQDAASHADVAGPFGASYCEGALLRDVAYRLWYRMFVHLCSFENHHNLSMPICMLSMQPCCERKD